MLGATCQKEYADNPWHAQFMIFTGVGLAAIVACVVSHLYGESRAIESRIVQRNRSIEWVEKVTGCDCLEFRQPLTRQWWDENADDTIAIRIPTGDGLGEYELEPATFNREGIDLTVWDSDWHKSDWSRKSGADKAFVTVNLPTITTVGQLSLLRRALESVEECGEKSAEIAPGTPEARAFCVGKLHRFMDRLKRDDGVDVAGDLPVEASRRKSVEDHLL